MTFGTVNASQAWAILHRHAKDEIGPLRLQELCRDNDRVSSLVSVHNFTSVAYSMTLTGEEEEEDRMLLVDLSRQRMTTSTLNYLLQLATARELQAFIQHLSWGGQNDPNDPIRTSLHSHSLEGDKERGAFKKKHNNMAVPPPPPPIDTTTTSYTTDGQGLHSTSPSFFLSSMHMALRVPKDQGYNMLLRDGTNALDGIHYEWNRLERLSTLIRQGQFCGATGQMLQTCLVIGTGVAVRALQFAHQALLHDERAVLASRAGLADSSHSGNHSSHTSAAHAATAAAQRLLSRPRSILLSAAAAATGSMNPNASSAMNPNSSSQTQHPARRLVVLSTLDTVAVAKTLSELDAASTLVISIALQGKEETGLVTSIVKQWLLQELGGNSHLASGSSSNDRPLSVSASSSSLHANSGKDHPMNSSNKDSHRRTDHILSKHMMLVTANPAIASVINKPESVHLVPQHCSSMEAFTTFTAAALLPLSIVYGWATAREFLAGAHDMDCHLVQSNPRHCLPVLLALSDVWNDILLGSSRIVTPFSHGLAQYPSLCAALESQVCGHSAASTNTEHGSSPRSGSGIGGGASATPASMVVVDGGMAGTYDRALFQSETLHNSELLLTLDPQLHFNALRRLGDSNSSNRALTEAMSHSQDTLVCTMFAHADELAFGSVLDPFSGNHSDPSSSLNLMTASASSSTFSPTIGTHLGSDVSGHHHRVSRGNRPSSLLLCNKLDAYSCGQLIALAEHRAAIKAHILGLQPPPTNNNSVATDLGSSLRAPRTEQFKEGLTHILSALSSEEHDHDEDEEEAAILAAVGGTMNLSTRTILKHYAKLIRGTRISSQQQ